MVGSVPTTTNYNISIIDDHCPHGEIIILPTTNNIVGYHFSDMSFERVNTLTNVLTPTNNLANPGGALPGQGGGLGAGGAAITNFIGLMEDEVWQSTNHAWHIRLYLRLTQCCWGGRIKYVLSSISLILG